MFFAWPTPLKDPVYKFANALNICSRSRAPQNSANVDPGQRKNQFPIATVVSFSHVQTNSICKTLEGTAHLWVCMCVF